MHQDDQGLEMIGSSHEEENLCEQQTQARNSCLQIAHPRSEAGKAHEVGRGHGEGAKWAVCYADHGKLDWREAEAIEDVHQIIDDWHQVLHRRLLAWHNAAATDAAGRCGLGW